MSLQERIEHWFAQGSAAVGNGEAEAAFFELRNALEAGELRSAEPDASLPLGWRVNAWVSAGGPGGDGFGGGAFFCG